MLRKPLPHAARPATALAIVLIGLAVIPAAAHIGRGSNGTELSTKLIRSTSTSSQLEAPATRDRAPRYRDSEEYERANAVRFRTAKTEAAVQTYLQGLAYKHSLDVMAKYKVDLERQRIEQVAADKVAAERERQRRAAPAPAPVARPAAPSEANSSSCGGDLPPCYVLRQESGGNPRAQNPRTSASGLWQFLDSTWAGFGGYARAMDAPVSVQNEKARIVWAGGAGCGNWAAC